MKVAITGASGMIGSAVAASLRRDGHDVVAIGRRPGPDTHVWDPDAGQLDPAHLEGVDAVVHLAGEGIGEKRWTPEQKRRIHDSRTNGTQLLADTMASMSSPPSVLLSGSAIGYYGDTGDREVDESAPAGADFLATVCVDWEAAAAPAAAAGVRVAYLRTGIVLSADGGVLARQLPFFKMGLGGRSGPGTQWQSWISLDDEVSAIRFLLDHDVAGPVNLTAPEPVTNGQFAATLARLLHRPCTIIPMIGPRLLYGRELTDSLLLVSQRVVPVALGHHGFGFSHRTLDEALGSLLGLSS